MIFYASGHTGVLYDCDTHQQCLLQGHVSQSSISQLVVDYRHMYVPCHVNDVMYVCSNRVVQYPVLLSVEMGGG